MGKEGVGRQKLQSFVIDKVVSLISKYFVNYSISCWVEQYFVLGFI